MAAFLKGLILLPVAIGVVLLCVSLVVLLFINGLEWWSRRHER